MRPGDCEEEVTKRPGAQSQADQVKETIQKRVKDTELTDSLKTTTLRDSSLLRPGQGAGSRVLGDTQPTLNISSS